MKTEGLVQVFCGELCEVSQNNFMLNDFERLLLDVKRCCGKQILQKLKIHQSSYKHKDITALETVLMSYELHLTNYLK